MTFTPRTRILVRALVLLGVDLAALWGAWWLATTLRLGAYWGADFREHNLNILLEHSAIFLFFGVLFEAYDPRRPFASRSELLKLAGGFVIAALVELLFFYFRTAPAIGRGIFVLNAALFIVFAVAGRLLYTFIGGSDFFKHRAIVVMSGDVNTPLLGELRRATSTVYDIQGYLAPIEAPPSPGSPPWLGDGENLAALVQTRRIDTIIVSSHIDCWDRYIADLIGCRYRGTEIVDLASACERFLNRIPCDHITELWLLWGLMSRSSLYVTRLKRGVDVVLSLAMLLVSLPLMAIIAMAVKLSSEGPVFYSQERIGQHNRPFRLLKFRSMIDGAENDSGPVWAEVEDPRVTQVGRWLRRTRLDELPQLLNVLKGDMSLVGPRPERGVFVSEFLLSLPMYNQRHAVRPGITGWGQINYDYAASREQSREKLEYDLFYVKNASLFLDLAILLRTTRTLLGGQGR